MSIARKILNWTDEKSNEIDMMNDKHPYLKAFGLGGIEGFIDGCIIMYPIVVGSLYWKAYKDSKNNK